MAFSAALAARGLSLGPKLTDNELKNPTYDQDNYPVWTNWNGDYGADNLTHDTGSRADLASWGHYSPLFNEGYSSYIGTQFHRAFHPYALDGFSPYRPEPRIIKVYGAESLFTTGAGISNNNADRGASQVGYFTNGGNSRIITNTTSSFLGPSSTSSINRTNAWVRSTEWTQQVAIPDSATSATFGAQIRVASDDKLRPLNWAGIYIAQDREPTSGTFVRYVNYFGIRHTNATFTLPTGQLSSSTQSSYNWSGLGAKSPTQKSYYYTPQWTVISQHAMLDQDDYEDFESVEYTFTLQSGTSRYLNFNIFFAENCSYLYSAAGEFTGGFQVFEPKLVFS